jgi:anti-sigma regulatory factor (Ser/Thr protein kinase)
MPPDSPAAFGPRTCLSARQGPTNFNGRSLHAAPTAVGAAREFAAATLGELAENDTDHASDIAVIVSELVTNAITHVAGIRNVWLEIEIWPRWTRVIVDDRDPTVHPPDEAEAADPLPESLRGLLIVRALSERFWWRTRTLSKAAHAVVLHSGIALTAADRALLDALEHSEGERMWVVR